jgi:hypothetical protein
MKFNLQLNWEQVSDEIYEEVWEAHIFYGFVIRVANNGDSEDKFYNVHLFNMAGNEVDTLDGDPTLKGAKANARDWVIEECEQFLTPV